MYVAPHAGEDMIRPHDESVRDGRKRPVPPPRRRVTISTWNVPYRFFGISEQLSWLAQFAGQGFEDIAGLANLIMLQEMMLG